MPVNMTMSIDYEHGGFRRLEVVDRGRKRRKRVLKAPSYFPPVERFSRFAGALDVGRDY